MQAVVYKGARDVAVEDVPDAAIEEPTDAVLRITTTNICGSDLHMYEGRTSVEEGTVLGHENIGVVEAVGGAVTRIRVGDRVSVPFNIACGSCRNCVDGFTSHATLGGMIGNNSCGTHSVMAGKTVDNKPNRRILLPGISAHVLRMTGPNF